MAGHFVRSQAASRNACQPCSVGAKRRGFTSSQGQRLGNGELMGRQVVVVLYVLALVAVVVGVDVLFFRDHAWERLTVNVGIVLVFAAFYFRFLRLF